MFKKSVSIFFTVVFLGLISAPSIIVAIDDSIDISILYSLSEEEEGNKNLEVVSSQDQEEINPFQSLLKFQNLGYQFKTYPKPHLNLVSPPPEFNIL